MDTPPKTTPPHSTPSSAPLLSVRSVSKRFHLPQRPPLEILEGVSFELSRGQSLSLSGPSGSGKSTLTHLIAGTESLSEGEMLWCGDQLPLAGDEARDAWRLEHVGLVFQDFRLFPHLSALENAALPLELLGLSAREAEERVRPLLSEVGLEGRLTHTPSELSGGEQQRVALARALAHNPSLIIADEPTGNLDWRSAGQVADLLFELPRSRDVALIIVTHDMSLARRADLHFHVTQGRLARAEDSAWAQGGAQ